jgi:hypothetical protein
MPNMLKTCCWPANCTCDIRAHALLLLLLPLLLLL